MAGRNTAVERLRRRFLEGFREARLLGFRRRLGLGRASNFHYRGWLVLALEGGWLRKGGIHSNAGVWTMGTRQQWVDNSSPWQQVRG